MSTENSSTENSSTKIFEFEANDKKLSCFSVHERLLVLCFQFCDDLIDNNCQF